MKRQDKQQDIKLLSNEQVDAISRTTKMCCIIGISGSVVGAVFFIIGKLKEIKLYSTTGFLVILAFIVFAFIKVGQKKSILYSQTSDYCLSMLEKTFGDNRNRQSRQYIESIIRETDLGLDWDTLAGDSYKECKYMEREFFIVNYSLLKKMQSDDSKNEPDRYDVKSDGIFIHCPIDVNYPKQKQILNEKLDNLAGCEVLMYAKSNFVNVFIKTEKIFGDYGGKKMEDVEGIRKCYEDSLHYISSFLDEFFKDKNLFV